jgi:hypothetical protein
MADHPVGEIIKNITDSGKLLARDTVELAKSELVPALKNGGIGAGLFMGAAYFAICALSVLYFALGFGLAALFDWPTWLGFLVVGILLFLIAGICGGIGFSLVRKVKAPERTIAQVNETVTEVKAAAQHALAAAKAPQIEGKVVNQRAIR